MEHPPNGADFGQVAAILAHKMAKLTNDAVAIRGDDLNQHAHSARTVAFEGGFLKLLAFELAGAAKDGALNVLVRHVFVFARQNGGSQARIGVRIAAADARRDGNFPNDARENAAALCVSGRFLVFNRCPF